MLKKYSIVIFLPCLLKLLAKFVFATNDLFVVGDLIEDIIFSLMILLFLLNLDSKYIYLKHFLISVFVVYFIVETSSILIIKSNFSASFMFALLDSNKIELFDFFKSYFTYVNLIFILIYCVIYVLLIRINFTTKVKMSFLLKAFIGIIFIAFLKFTGLIENNLYYNIVRGGFGYYQLNSMVGSISAIDSTKLSVNLDNDVLVVVLGESIARNHMQLYNYKRPTTPLLDKMKDSLMIYNNVITPEVLTTKAIPELLTSFSINENNRGRDNIIKILNDTDYQTYWISNQRPIGFHENVVSKLVSSSKYIKFLTYKSHEEHSNFDGVVLPELKEVLSKPGRKVIFIHLIGAHFKYSNRYPNDFNQFISKGTNTKQNTINHYDNAIFYNDYIVYSILQQVKSHHDKSAVLYVSDHGEDVFDQSNFSGHSESSITKSMVEVPFVLWTSNTYQLPIDFEYEPNRKFMTDDFFSSLGHILGIKYPSIDYTKSIFSKSFKEKERIIVNGIDYDQNF